ncbi:hypothetical protein BFP97_16875 [Roseivirga sp. 4D4]|uniref:hypothetical protein n=1 Tax=Roseivirga sp. 4D4 TaxID=1889784 RepID=UPI0008537240|nr:hypothetical protein [Roseivirga sp. 4D4]OEK03092.1 hypothetical protein BFP97_16875 [Roseivirga sp. 4D4]
MATSLKILGWKSEGLRCPDHSISFEAENGQVHKISLIQMPNGTGKTTTLKLLRAALAGPQFWDEHFDRSVDFRKSEAISEGEFELRLLHNDRFLTIKLLFDFHQPDSIPEYKTILNKGVEDGFKLPSELIPFLKPEFVRLLVFDGEYANDLLDSKKSNAQQAIDNLYRLPLLEQMSDRIEDYWKALADAAGSSGGEKEKTQRDNRVKALTERLKEVKKQKEKDDSEIRRVNSQLEELDSQFSEEIKKYENDHEQLNKANDEYKEASTLLANKTRLLAITLKNPAELSQEFDESILDLKESFDRVKLPGLAAKEFFEEIADEDECICGREITDNVRSAIKSRANKYLGSEEVSTLNTMKSEIKDRTSENASLSSGLLHTRLSEVIDSQNAQNSAKLKVDAIKNSVGAKDPRIQKIQDQIKTLTSSLTTLEVKYEKYLDKKTKTDKSWNLEVLAERLEDAKEKLAETTGTIDQKIKKDVLQGILVDAHARAKELLSENVCDQVNDRISELMPHNNIRVNEIENSLKLINKSGGSAGENLTIGYAYLSTLLTNTEHRLPSVVDSPTGAIDLAIRKEIGGLIPKLGDQFICFIISSERNGFVKHLVRRSTEGPYFLTMFRKGNTEIDGEAQKQALLYESVDGMCVVGKEYFDQFHTDDLD